MTDNISALNHPRSKNWQKIWKKRALQLDIHSTLGRLLAADGYDGIAGISENEFLEFISWVSNKLKIVPNDSIFEVGCGAGAVLYPFYQKGHTCSGVDYAKNLIEIAQATMSDASFDIYEAININTIPQYDIVISMGVFIYFPTHDYAALTLQKMIHKARKSVGIFDYR